MSAAFKRRPLNIDDIRRLHCDSAGTPAGCICAIKRLCRGRIRAIAIAFPIPYAALSARVYGLRQHVGITRHIHRRRDGNLNISADVRYVDNPVCVVQRRHIRAAHLDHDGRTIEHITVVGSNGRIVGIAFGYGRCGIAVFAAREGIGHGVLLRRHNDFSSVSGDHSRAKSVDLRRCNPIGNRPRHHLLIVILPGVGVPEVFDERVPPVAVGDVVVGVPEPFPVCLVRKCRQLVVLILVALRYTQQRKQKVGDCSRPV